MTAATDAHARITIDPNAVARNWRALAARTGAETAAVVKANAYGLGIEVVAPALLAAGCRTFCVAFMSEGLTLRALAPDATIYVLNGIFDDRRTAIDARLVPFISDDAALKEWPNAPFVLNVDTGMHRLGFTPWDAALVSRRPVLIASHFACADTPDHPLNATQEAAFAAIRNHLPEVPASLANSAAVLTRPHAHYQLTRPGIALYGGIAADAVAPLEPAVSLEARIIQVRSVPARETVGYGAAQTMTRDSRIAIASLGYADGYLRAAGGSDEAPGAPAAFDGQPVKLCGRVSMDLVSVDVTNTAAKRGDWLELFGPTVPLADAAAAAGTIGYELLTGLSRRAERIIGRL
ncbi:MAG: alanine racemase [Pseudomonadota bacterium]